MRERSYPGNEVRPFSSAGRNTRTFSSTMRQWTHALVILSLRAAVPVGLGIGGVLMMMLVPSCNKHENREPPPVIATEYDRIPPDLQRIGQRAEGIVLAVPAQDWPRVYAYVKEINDTWGDYKRPTVQPPSEPSRFPAKLMVGQLDAALAALKSAAAARDAGATMKAANDVNAAAVDLFAFYNPSIPPGMHRLAVLERRILLDSADGDLTRTPDTLNRVRTAWDGVRTTVSSHVSNMVVSQFDQHIADQQAALDANDSGRLSATAREALTMIDQMQRLYYPDTEGLG